MNIINQLNNLDIYYNKNDTTMNVIKNTINTDEFITNIFDNYKISFPLIDEIKILSQNEIKDLTNSLVINSLTIETIFNKSYFSTIIVETYLKDLFKQIIKQLYQRIYLNEIDDSLDENKINIKVNDNSKLNKKEKLLLIDTMLLELNKETIDHYDYLILKQEELNKFSNTKLLKDRMLNETFFVSNNFKEFNIDKEKKEINIKKEYVNVEGFNNRIIDLNFITTNCQIIQPSLNIKSIYDILFNLIPIIDFKSMFNYNDIKIEFNNDYSNDEFKKRILFLFKLLDLNKEIIKLDNLQFKNIFVPIYKDNKIYKIIYLWCFLFFLSNNELKDNLINIILSLLTFLRKDLNFKNKKTIHYYIYLLNKFELIDSIIDVNIF